jgi:hypothetical protein
MGAKSKPSTARQAPTARTPRVVIDVAVHQLFNEPGARKCACCPGGVTARFRPDRRRQLDGGAYPLTQTTVNEYSVSGMKRVSMNSQSTSRLDAASSM